MDMKDTMKEAKVSNNGTMTERCSRVRAAFEDENGEYVSVRIIERKLTTMTRLEITHALQSMRGRGEVENQRGLGWRLKRA